MGRLRRNMIAGHRLIELWKDGLFIHIAPGDEDFLGWRMGGEDRPIHISNFVLAESVLVFCWLMKFVFEEADPQPPVLRLTVGFDNLKRPSGLPTLSTTPEGRMRFPGSARPAPAEAVEVYQLAETAKVGIRLTQVAPRCSMRPWWKNTPEIWRSWRRSSAQKRHVGRTWRGCDGRMVSAVRAAVAAGRGRFAECCWSARVVAAKLR